MNTKCFKCEVNKYCVEIKRQEPNLFGLSSCVPDGLVSIWMCETCSTAHIMEQATAHIRGRFASVTEPNQPSTSSAQRQMEQPQIQQQQIQLPDIEVRIAPPSPDNDVIAIHNSNSIVDSERSDTLQSNTTGQGDTNNESTSDSNIQSISDGGSEQVGGGGSGSDHSHECSSKGTESSTKDSDHVVPASPGLN